MNNYKAKLLSFLSIFLMGCSGSAGKASVQKYSLTEVFYATDRKIEDKSDMESYFGVDRGKLVYGEAKVSIPFNHKIGELESPHFLSLNIKEDRELIFGADPERHVVLLDIEEWPIKTYFKKMATRINQASNKNALVYIHGYNVTFEDAARRTAQMAYDLKFNGVSIFYSWPSHGNPSKYTFDEANIQWTESHLKSFLADFLAKSGAENIYLIAHSMGNRALTRAYLEVVRANPALGKRVKEVILAAPDIDADVFKRDIAPAMVQTGTSITLYASSMDIALKASKVVHGGHPRAGDSGDDIVIISGIETIDATKAKASFLGHSSHTDAPSVISDMAHMIKGLRANQRAGLEKIKDIDGYYWILKNSADLTN